LYIVEYIGYTIMIIRTLKLDNKHWSTDWIPISYESILFKSQYEKSYTYLWSENNKVLAICRSYYMSKPHIEIGDVWISENIRGRYIGNTKISVLFMQKVLNKIWKNYPGSTKVSLIVSKDNIPAIKLYEKLNFQVIKKISSNKLGITNGLYMELYKSYFVRKKNLNIK